MITVMGATGHTGRKVAENLLRAGQKVRAIGRSESKLAELKRAGADVLAGDTRDLAFLADAFRGATAVYTLVAVNAQARDYRAAQDEQGEVIAQAIRDSGVGYVVGLSSIGADLSEGNGLIGGLHAQEERLGLLARDTGTHVLLLRPVSFFENFHERLPLIKHQGINGDSLAPELAIPMVATRDIAAAAANALATRDWSGVVVRELLGPCDYTHVETTRLLGQRIGKPDLKYVQFSDADMAGALVQAGLSESFAELYVEMTRAMNKEMLKPRAGRTAENSTPTRFEDFVDELARAYQAL